MADSFDSDLTQRRKEAKAQEWKDTSPRRTQSPNGVPNHPTGSVWNRLALLSHNIVAFCEDFGARNLFRFNVRRFERATRFPSGTAGESEAE